MILKTDPTSTEPTPAVTRAAAVLRAGGLVAFPTETVYGLGAVATDARAVARIFEAKDRPHFDPPSSTSVRRTGWIAASRPCRRKRDGWRNGFGPAR